MAKRRSSKGSGAPGLSSKSWEGRQHKKLGSAVKTATRKYSGAQGKSIYESLRGGMSISASERRERSKSPSYRRKPRP